MAEDIVKEAREALQLSHDADSDNRREAMEDLRFAAGDQWSDQAKADRKGRPMITINRSGQFLRQVSNPIRQNMPTIKVEPDGEADLELAEVANGLFRRIQYNSSASHVYAVATEHMVACGIGWWRIGTDYLDDESFDQEIIIKRVFNPLSVYPDPAALEPDRSDMNWCLVSEVYPVQAFKNRWPGKAIESLDTPTNSQNMTGLSWNTTDTVRVAEYWRRKATERTLLRLQDGTTHDLSTFSKRGLEYLKFNGMIAGERKTKGYKVVMTLVSGSEQLEEAYECPCKWIPLVPVIGAEIPLENGIYRHGLLRFQKEPQQLHNYFMSSAAEMIGMQPKAPVAATANQIKNYKAMWDNANRKATPYLLYDHDPQNPGPPKRIEPPAFPTAMIQMAQMLAEDMKATTGIYDAALGAKSNETSGVAIAGRVEQGSQATFHFSDNLQHGLEHTGRIILDMIPKVYDTARTLRMVGEDGTETEAEINRPTIAEDGESMLINDMSRMKFKSVRVIMGQNYASRKAEAVQSLANLIQAMPQIGQVGADIVVRNMEFEGSEQLAERLKTTLPPQILQIENPDAVPPPPDPMADPVVGSQVQLNIARANLANAQAQAAGMQGQESMEGEPEDPALHANVSAAHAKARQEHAKAFEAEHRVQGAALDNALKVKKLREPSPLPSNGIAGNRPQ